MKNITKFLGSAVIAGLLVLNNAFAQTPEEKAKYIEDIKKQILEYKKLNFEGFVEIKSEILSILEGKYKVEDEVYPGQYLSQLEKEIFDSFHFVFSKIIDENDYKGFSEWLDGYKIEMDSLDTCYFLERLLDKQDKKFFEILKEKQFDKMEVFDGNDKITLLQYLQKNNVKDEILKIFK
ncbi:MAG: hypothetical protein K5978_03690 [Campylobacter sp.]|nr:hypothetical protein [Campylobacter sp.]